MFRSFEWWWGRQFLNRGGRRDNFWHQWQRRREMEHHAENEFFYFQKYKGGMDTLDQVVRGYSYRRKSNRSPCLLFCNLLDISAYNAMVLFLHIHPNYEASASHRRRKFLVELAKSMLPQQMATVVSVQRIDDPQPAKIRKVARCQSCPRSSDRKTPHSCDKCNESVCKNHMQVICHKCK